MTTHYTCGRRRTTEKKVVQGSHSIRPELHKKKAKKQTGEILR